MFYDVSYTIESLAYPVLFAARLIEFNYASGFDYFLWVFVEIYWG